MKFSLFKAHLDEHRTEISRMRSQNVCLFLEHLKHVKPVRRVSNHADLCSSLESSVWGAPSASLHLSHAEGEGLCHCFLCGWDVGIGTEVTGNWSPACPGTSWVHGHLGFYRPFPLVPLWISLWKLELCCNGTPKVFYYCRGILSVLEIWVDLPFLDYAAGLRRELFRETFSHSCCRSCQPCVLTPLPPHLGKQSQYTLSTGPLASCGPVLTNLSITEC